MTHTPILDRLKRERVFEIRTAGKNAYDELIPSDKVCFAECCDGCFGCELTRDEVTALAGELLSLVAEMPTPGATP